MARQRTLEERAAQYLKTEPLVAQKCGQGPVYERQSETYYDFNFFNIAILVACIVIIVILLKNHWDAISKRALAFRELFKRHRNASILLVLLAVLTASIFSGIDTQWKQELSYTFQDSYGTTKDQFYTRESKPTKEYDEYLQCRRTITPF